MKRFIITGGAGFVGSTLARQLQQTYPDGRILVVDDMRVGHFANHVKPRPGYDGLFEGTWIARPIHEIDLHELVAKFKPDVIFHEASITDTTLADQAQMIQPNVEAFEKLLDVAVAHGIKLVWASSAATYGMEANGAVAARRPFALEDAGRPANIYGFSKWVMENMHRQALADHPDLHIVGLRYFNVYGPGEGYKGPMASMVYQLANQMLAGNNPRIFHDGDQARDQVYIKDVVGATIAAADDAAESGIYNVGTGVATSFNQIIELLNQSLGTDLEPEYFDNPYSFYQDYTCADLTQTRVGLHWQPQYHAADAVSEYASWLKDTHEGSGVPAAHEAAMSTKGP